MSITKSKVRVGQKPPKEVIQEVRRAVRRPVKYTEEFPPLSQEALKEFAQLAAERNRQKKKRLITIRITPDVLDSYKTMGSGYTGIMSDVLQYAVNNPSVLAAATK